MLKSFQKTRLIAGILLIGILSAQTGVNFNPSTHYAMASTGTSGTSKIILNQPFNLGFNGEATLDQADLRLHFTDVTEDSRCPSDVVCIWAGQVSVLIEMRSLEGAAKASFLLTSIGGSGGPDSIKIESGGKSYEVKLQAVQPYPVSTKPIELTDYVITLMVSEDKDGTIGDPSLVVSSPVAIDSSGSEENEIAIGFPTLLSSTIDNISGENKTFLAVVEARSLDDGGTTRFLLLTDGTVSANARADVASSWTPESAGTYQIRMFLLDNLDVPQILSPVLSSEIDVVEPISLGANDGDGNSASTQDAVITGNNKFALDFFSNLVQNGEEKNNIFFSPWSITTALALVNEGARGQTSDEMQSVFGFPADDDARRAAFSEIQKDLNSGKGNYSLSTANALWIKDGYKLSDNYVDVAKQSYDSEVANVDFTKEQTRLQINGWVESKTNEKIKDLIPPGILDELTRLVITNAIYFKGTWVTQFDEKNTTAEDFRIDAQNSAKVPMMKLEEEYFRYGETDSMQIIELPYHGEKVSMLVLLPKNIDDAVAVEKSLTVENLAALKQSLKNQTVTVQFPKFKLETEYSLSKSLSEMGMPTAFDPDRADLSGITTAENLYISAALHKAFVEVNEEGTEAAAATGVIIGTESFHEIPVFKADHPFVFVIQDSETGNILFLGKLTNPSNA